MHTATTPDTGWRAVRLPLTIAGGFAGALTLLHVRDPHVSGSYGFCPFQRLTGMACPGCGGMRAVNDLTNGEIVASLSSNVWVLPALAFAVAAWCVWTYRRWHGQRRGAPAVSTPAIVAVVAFLVVFTVVRNTPWGAWLAP